MVEAAGTGRGGARSALMIGGRSVAEVPGLRVVVRIGPLRLLRVLALVYVIGFSSFVVIKEHTSPLTQGRDPMTYLAAGERLNAGHDLYRLEPGDRPVAIMPPYWSVPLLSPPPIAVAWRPIALVGEAGALVWWLGGIAATLAMVWTILRRGTAVALVGVVVLTPPIALTAISGNANAYLVPLLFAAWLARERPWLVGGAIAIAAAVKLTPILLVGWLLLTGRYRAVVATAVACAVLFLVGLLGAGWQAYLDWLPAAAGAQPTDLSLAALTGLPAALIATAVGLVALVVAAAVRRAGLGFGATVVGAVIASPAFYFAPIAMLTAGLAPAVIETRSR